MRTHTTKLKWVLLCLFVGLSLSPILSATRTIVNTGNWGSGATWQSGQPLNGDDVVMNDNTGVTVRLSDGFLSIGSFTAGNNNDLTINAFGSLTANSLDGGTDLTITVNGTLIIDGDFAVGDRFNLVVNGIFTVIGNMSVMNDANIQVNGLMGVGSFNGLDRVNFDVNTFFASAGDFFVGNDSSFDSDGASLFGGSVTAKDRFDLHIDGGVGIAGDLNAGSGSTSTGIGNLVVDGDINGPPGFGALTPLPITLRYFKGEAQEDGVLLSWGTESEESNAYFTIEKSRDGVHFEDLKQIKGAGDSEVPLDYKYYDPQPYKLTYYRLKQTDYDGTSETFNIVSVQLNGARDKIKVYPSLVQESWINIDLPTTDETLEVRLTDMSGRVIWQRQVLSGKNTLDLPSELDNGMYILTLFDQQTQFSSVHKIMVQR